MNPHPDVDPRAGSAVAQPTTTAQPDAASCGNHAPKRDPSAAIDDQVETPPGDRRTSGRESIDPLRATDRYRLAAPLGLRG